MKLHPQEKLVKMSDFNLLCPFWIDTEGYSDRDRLMFCCGFEFQQFFEKLKTNDPFELLIHRENETRMRLTCARYKRQYLISHDEEKDPNQEWAFLKVL
jgi:hypothetical protein